ncbi:hypothetical protein CYMTET_31514 [Cymbomonas tetramitiformis]|uniref:Tyrosine-specific transport protein n=1 Tax=Cymbomonas tetramitiformis TaxID=36881 RepID=A0AAE0FHQ0_9CHLO|nr:hypothetical protein CYMTET_31514 [Cymbomonas tetramitiformis]
MEKTAETYVKHTSMLCEDKVCIRRASNIFPFGTKGTRKHERGHLRLNASNNGMAKDTSKNLTDNERLWSNVDLETYQHEPGSLFGAASLVGGTAVGAGILALPAQTQASGFVASSSTLVACWLYMVVTGLLLAEVNLCTLCELGSGGVSLTSMAQRTLGDLGTNVSVATYLLLHYTLLVAYISKAGGLVAEIADLPLPLSLIFFTVGVGGVVYVTTPRQLNRINSGLVIGVLVSFFSLLLCAGANVDLQTLQVAHWEAVPKTIPIVSLAFVYHNVVPVIVTRLEVSLLESITECPSSLRHGEAGSLARGELARIHHGVSIFAAARGGGQPCSVAGAFIQSGVEALLASFCMSQAVLKYD